MKLLQDPNPKKTSFLSGLLGELIIIGLILLAFVYGIGWLIMVLQAFIIFLFVVGVFPTGMDAKYLSNRLRYEQQWIYPSLNIFLYWIMSADPIFACLYFVAVVVLSMKYDSAIRRLDHKYTVKQNHQS